MSDAKPYDCLDSIRLPPPPKPPQILINDAPSEPSPVPSPQFGWTCHHSSNNGLTYFYNTVTGASTYKTPAGWSESTTTLPPSPLPTMVTPGKGTPKQSPVVGAWNLFTPEKTCKLTPIDMEISPREVEKFHGLGDIPAKKKLHVDDAIKLSSLVDVAQKHTIAVEVLEKFVMKKSMSITPASYGTLFYRFNQIEEQMFERELQAKMNFARSKAREAIYHSLEAESHMREADICAAVVQVIRQLQSGGGNGMKSMDDKEHYRVSNGPIC